jgi:uncharacterized protein YaiI (UPF0178 family)
VAERTQIQVTLVANQLLRVPGSKFIRSVQVPSGADVADAEIVERLNPATWSSPATSRWRRWCWRRAASR